MKLGAMFLPVELPVFLASVQAAEESNYDRVWVCDSQMIWEDTYVYMTHALEATRRVSIGTAVTNPVMRHYSVTASGHATLAKHYPGRVILGIGRGESSVRTLSLPPM